MRGANHLVHLEGNREAEAASSGGIITENPVRVEEAVKSLTRHAK